MIDTLSSVVLAWLLTYLIHSTELLGLAWAFTRIRSWSPAALDVVLAPGDIIFPFKTYVQTPITLTIEAGRITSI